MARTPDGTVRSASRQPPAGMRPVMRQTWTDLLFVHFRADAHDVQRSLPDGLAVDTFDGSAWIGIVPFFMRRIRPTWAPAVPWLSNFLELNVRTYVFDRERGIPGVWFFSLDCDRAPAVWFARTFFHLPYRTASMSASKGADGTVEYRCRRRRAANGAAYRYPTGAAAPMLRNASGDTLEFFLLERYRLFSYARRRAQLYEGAVAHRPYPFYSPRAQEVTFDPAPLNWNGLPNVRGRPPDHIAVSPGVDVEVFPLQPV